MYVCILYSVYTNLSNMMALNYIRAYTESNYNMVRV